MYQVVRLGDRAYTPLGVARHAQWTDARASRGIAGQHSAASSPPAPRPHAVSSDDYFVASPAAVIETKPQPRIATSSPKWHVLLVPGPTAPPPYQAPVPSSSPLSGTVDEDRDAIRARLVRFYKQHNVAREKDTTAVNRVMLAYAGMYHLLWPDLSKKYGCVAVMLGPDTTCTCTDTTAMFSQLMDGTAEMPQAAAAVRSKCDDEKKQNMTDASTSPHRPTTPTTPTMSASSPPLVNATLAAPRAPSDVQIGRKEEPTSGVGGSRPLPFAVSQLIASPSSSVHRIGNWDVVVAQSSPSPP